MYFSRHIADVLHDVDSLGLQQLNELSPHIPLYSVLVAAFGKGLVVLYWLPKYLIRPKCAM